MWTNENRSFYNRSTLRYPSDLTDEEWALTEPSIPPAKRGGEHKRQFAEPLFWPAFLDLREVLPVHARRAPIGAAQSIGMGQDIFAVNPVAQA